MPSVTVTVDVDAPPEQTWAAIIDWEHQGEWILATRVRRTSTVQDGLGTEVEAFTGLGRVGVRDTMRVTEWDPPRRCTMEHTGRLIRGRGVFAVHERAGGSTFSWTEDLDLPFGVLGRIAWPLVRPLTRWGLQRSVNRFATFAQSYPSPPGPVTQDNRIRCAWAESTPEYRDYHDTEWGVELLGDAALFERLSLEAFQSGLSWLTILRKREAFRRAFAHFVIADVAAFDDSDVARLMVDAGIVRNRAKINATIANARVALDVPGGLSELLWSFAPTAPQPRPTSLADVPATSPESVEMATALKRRGFSFVGPTTAYALMQATGMVDDHVAPCWRAGR